MILESWQKDKSCKWAQEFIEHHTRELIRTRSKVEGHGTKCPFHSGGSPEKDGLLTSMPLSFRTPSFVPGIHAILLFGCFPFACVLSLSLGGISFEGGHASSLLCPHSGCSPLKGGLLTSMPHFISVPLSFRRLSFEGGPPHFSASLVCPKPSCSPFACMLSLCLRGLPLLAPPKSLHGGRYDLADLLKMPVDSEDFLKLLEVMPSDMDWDTSDPMEATLKETGQKRRPR